MRNSQLKPIAKAMVLAFALSANASHSADKTDPATPPSQGNALIPKRYLDVPPDMLHLPSIKEIMVVLKPAMRTYAKTHYDWGKGKKEYRREEVPLSAEKIHQLSQAVGIELKSKPISSSAVLAIPEGTHMNDEEARAFSMKDGLELVERTHILLLPHAMTFEEAEAVAARIRALPDILYADPSVGGGNLAVPTDPLYGAQWNLKGAGGGANLPPAWDISTGKNTVVVAVIDSGILASHPELSDRVLPGYDFISDTTRANDGGGRDADPTDPGDWVTAAQAAGNCKEATSSWHGTRVASIIAANANNGVGIAGVDWQAKILPVRVAGKCVNGYQYNGTDLIAAIRWAAGYTVSGAPTNANPAKVINLSLGGSGACGSTMQAAIDAARKKGAVVVAAVGNAGAASSQQPANCNGVIRVAAVDSKGGLASYSNRGESATLSAPGGDFSDPLELYTAGDGGTTTAINDGAVTGGRVGTSFAAPHASGVAALMRAIKPEMSPPQIAAILANTTRNFPTGTSFDCDVITCGTGILDAGQAVSGAKSKVAAGGYHTVAAKADGTVVTWGRNSYGALGGGESSSLTRPYPGSPLPGLSNVRDVAAGIWHVIALKGDGTVWGWGYNGQGMLGNGNTTNQFTPVQVSVLSDVVAISAGDRHSLALKSDGTVWAWGLNASGQLGRGAGNYTNSLVPVQVYALTGVTAISAGGKRSMALKSDGTVWAWGLNANATSDTNATMSPVPVQVPGLADIVAIESGGNTTGGTGVESDSSMAMTWDGKVYAWGYNNWGQLCQGDLATKFLPKEITLPSPAVKISVAEHDAVILLDDGSLMGCGSNFTGAMGDGTTTVRKSLSPVGSGLNNALDIEVGRDFTVAMGNNLSVLAWGTEGYGVLGNGSTTNIVLVPVQVHGAGNSGYFNTGYATSTSADLEVYLSDSPDPAQANSNLTYDFQVINFGPNDAANMIAVLALPSQVSFVSATPGCSYANSTVTCTQANMLSYDYAAFQVVVTPTMAATLDASASVSSDVYDPVSFNDVAGVSTIANAAIADSGDADVPIPAWALAMLGAGLLGAMRKKAG